MSFPSFAARLIASASAALSRGDDDLEALEGLDAAMVVVDATAPDRPLVYTNRSFRSLTGYENEEIVGRNCRFLQGEETDPRDRAKFREGVEAGKTFQITLTNHRKDGSTFRNQVFVSPVRDGGDVVTHFIGLLVPVDDEEQNNRIAELRHRMKNHIQSLTSLVSLQSRRVEGEEGRRALEDLKARVDTLGAIFVELETSGTGDVVALDPFIKMLVKRIQQGFDPAENHRIVFDLVPLAIHRSRAAIVGQIVTELLINVYRHAFVDQPAGTIRVSLRQNGGQVELAVADNGSGPGDKSKTKTLGLAIVSNLARSLDGTFEPMSSTGFVARLSFPLEAPTA
ncbi:signal transduction histidine kinase [Agaricicola taiwanensis]|uniref:Signal transduction histidine kinase n=1 Tax=Agaricicola taiwanensis TaxID=591372 RepID=A0A8J2VM96_9RHOB|nr:PAS domain-containing protein [Agaricicola taiwanensis]GGE30025.1 signal transduction histidine kinase [Agaricicola taiwanensis]